MLGFCIFQDFLQHLQARWTEPFSLIFHPIFLCRFKSLLKSNRGLRQKYNGIIPDIKSVLVEQSNNISAVMRLYKLTFLVDLPNPDLSISTIASDVRTLQLMSPGLVR